MRFSATCLFSIAILVALVATSDAQKKQQYFQKIGTKESVVIAAAPIDAASQSLRLHFPDSQLKTTGNAATHYFRAAVYHAKRTDKKRVNTVWNSLRIPLNEFDPDKYTKLLDELKFCLDEIEIGSQRKKCEWDSSFFEGQPLEVVQKALPEISEFRELSRLLRLKARIAIKQNNFKQAIHWLTVSNQFAIHVGQMEFIVCGLVGKRMIDGNLDLVEEMSGIRGAPNFHSAIVALPSPAIDFHRLVKQELDYWRNAFPELRNPLGQKKTVEEWRKDLQRFDKLGNLISRTRASDAPSDRETNFGWMAAHQYVTAKRELLKSGMKKDIVEKMPVGQTIIVHTSLLLNEYCDQSMEQLKLPAHQFVAPKLAVNGSVPMIAIAEFLGPTTFVVRSEFVLARRIAAIQNAQAVRHFMAKNRSRLPKSWDEVDKKLLAIDPMANKSFELATVKNGIAIRRTHPKKNYEVIEQIIYQTLSPTGQK